MPTDYSRGRYIQLKDYAGRHTPILLSAYFRCLTRIGLRAMSNQQF